MCLEYNKESIKIRALLGISILFENDLYELACFLVKMHRTQDEMANLKSSTTRQSSSSTLLGLAHNYAHLTNMPSDRVKEAMKQAGLSLGAKIECKIRSTLDTQSGSNWTVRPVLTGH